jgi:hypothetical protein
MATKLQLQPGVDETRIPCSACGQSIWLATIERDGTPVRVPIVVRIIMGQLPNSGEVVDVAAVPVPQIVRDIMALPVARVNLCIPCFAQVLKLKSVQPTNPLPAVAEATPA